MTPGHPHPTPGSTAEWEDGHDGALKAMEHDLNCIRLMSPEPDVSVTLEDAIIGRFLDICCPDRNNYVVVLVHLLSRPNLVDGAEQMRDAEPHVVPLLLQGNTPHGQFMDTIIGMHDTEVDAMIYPSSQGASLCYLTTYIMVLGFLHGSVSCSPETAKGHSGACELAKTLVKKFRTTISRERNTGNLDQNEVWECLLKEQSALGITDLAVRPVTTFHCIIVSVAARKENNELADFFSSTFALKDHRTEYNQLHNRVAIVVDTGDHKFCILRDAYLGGEGSYVVVETLPVKAEFGGPGSLQILLPDEAALADYIKRRAAYNFNRFYRTHDCTYGHLLLQVMSMQSKEGPPIFDGFGMKKFQWQTKASPHSENIDRASYLNSTSDQFSSMTTSEKAPQSENVVRGSDFNSSSETTTSKNDVRRLPTKNSKVLDKVVPANDEKSNSDHSSSTAEDIEKLKGTKPRRAGNSNLGADDWKSSGEDTSTKARTERALRPSSKISTVKIQRNLYKTRSCMTKKALAALADDPRLDSDLSSSSSVDLELLRQNELTERVASDLSDAVKVPWAEFKAFESGQLDSEITEVAVILELIASSTPDTDCRPYLAERVADPDNTTIPTSKPIHFGDRIWENQSELPCIALQKLLKEDAWVRGGMIEEFQRLMAILQNGGILELDSGKQIYVRQLGHARSTLHMLDLFYFENLFGINHENTTAARLSYADDQGNKVKWEKLVDEIKTRKESWAEDKIEDEKKDSPSFECWHGTTSCIPV